MVKKPSYRLGELQLQIMRVLWRNGEADVAAVRQQLSGSRLAYTTVATMLRKMEARGLVDHREQGRKFIYRSLVSEDEVTRSMADELVDRLFEGDLTSTVSHLLCTREVGADELDRLEALLREHRQQQRG